MSPENVDKLLNGYKAALGRCGYLQAQLSMLILQRDRVINNAGADLALAGGVNMDGMPHGSSVGNPTERIGLLLADNYVPEDAKELTEEIRKLSGELDILRYEVNTVKAWLAGLTLKQSWMIERQVFDEMCYREINYEFRERFGEGCSKDTLRRLSREAKARIYEMAR